MKICGIYKIVNPSKKVYIGQSIDIIKRFKRYKSKDCKGQIALYRSLEKYGLEKHDFEIVCQCSMEELNNLEVYYIELYNSFNSEFGLNLCSGGNANKTFSDETKKKLSDSHKGLNTWMKGRVSNNLGKKHSAESKKKMSDFQKANPPSFWKGKKLSKKHRKNISDSHKGKVPTENTRKKLSEAHKGKFVSLATREKLRIANTGKKLSKETINKIIESKRGHKPTEETKRKMSDAHKGHNRNKGNVLSSEHKKNIGLGNKNKPKGGLLKKGCKWTENRRLAQIIKKCGYL